MTRVGLSWLIQGKFASSSAPESGVLTELAKKSSAMLAVAFECKYRRQGCTNKAQDEI